uniref:Uncharacterized protein n=1 Tax=Lepeophtheirus salmonis TaxID=72036 RepID=A0A0K2TZU0_LEPSM
MHLKLNNADI